MVYGWLLGGWEITEKGRNMDGRERKRERKKKEKKIIRILYVVPVLCLRLCVQLS